MADAETVLDPVVPVLAETALTDRVARPAPVIVLFYADWCPYCRSFLPTFNECVDEAEVDVVAANVSHPEDPRWDEYDVEAIPTLIAFHEGTAVGRLDAVPGEGLGGDEFASFVDEVNRKLSSP